MNKQIFDNGQDDTILESLKGFIKRYYQNRKKMPTQKILMNKFGLTKYQLFQYIKILTHSGFLKQNYCHYKPNDGKQLDKKSNFKKKDYIIIVLRVVMIFIGIGAVIISAYYTTIWLMEFLHIILAVLSSVIMVMFSVGVFEVIIVLKGNKQFFLIIPLVFLWIIVVGFSMISTVIGQYNQRISNTNIQIIENSESIIDKEGYDLLLKEEKELEEKIKEKKEEKEPFISLMNDFEKTEDNDKKIKQIDNNYKKLKQINTDIDNLNKDLKQKRKEIKEYYKEKKEKGETIGATEKTVIKSKTSYQWIADVFKTDSQLIEFWLSMFLPTFVDIIAPFAIAIGMFLKRREEEIK